MKTDTRTYRTVAEEVGGKKRGRGQLAASWRIRCGEFWAEGVADKEVVFLVPDFEAGYIAAVREANWDESQPARAIGDLDAEVEDSDDEREQRLKRVRATSILRGSLSGGRFAIPREIVWLLQRDNEELRDVTVIYLDPIIEIWPTRRWQDYLSGHLFRDSSQAPPV